MFDSIYPVLFLVALAAIIVVAAVTAVPGPRRWTPRVTVRRVPPRARPDRRGGSPSDYF